MSLSDPAVVSAMTGGYGNFYSKPNDPEDVRIDVSVKIASVLIACINFLYPIIAICSHQEQEP